MSKRIPAGWLGSFGGVAISIVFATTSPLQAAIVTFADQQGTNVLFTGITEVNSNPDPAFTLFGGLAVVGDTLDFDAFQFRAEAMTGSFVPLDGRLSLTATAKTGYLINRITITEGGRAATFNQGSLAQVDLGGFVTMGGTMSAPQSTSYSLSGAAGSYDSDFWSRSLTFDFAARSSVNLDIDNALMAVAASPVGYAFIDKKGVLIDFGTVVIPEPAMPTALLGVLAGFLLRRRNRAKV